MERFVPPPRLPEPELPDDIFPPELVHQALRMDIAQLRAMISEHQARYPVAPETRQRQQDDMEAIHTAYNALEAAVRQGSVASFPPSLDAMLPGNDTAVRYVSTRRIGRRANRQRQ